jgi:hypothetical protein
MYTRVYTLAYVNLWVFIYSQRRFYGLLHIRLLVGKETRCLVL